MKDIPTACERYNVCVLHEHELATEKCNSTCQIKSERNHESSNVISSEDYKHARTGTAKSED